jgi:cytidyltransferase-like protein
MIIGVTSGCFDILHPTHVLFLEKCSRECDRLIVLIDSDERILQTKGNYPVFNEQDRLILLDALEVVDHVQVFNDIKDYVVSIEALWDKDDTIIVFKNRRIFPTSEVHQLQEVPNTTTKIIEDVKRFSSSTEIKQFIKSQFK